MVKSKKPNKSKKVSKKVSKKISVDKIPRGAVPAPLKDVIVENKFYRRFPDNPINRLNYV